VAPDGDPVVEGLEHVRETVAVRLVDAGLLLYDIAAGSSYAPFTSRTFPGRSARRSRSSRVRFRFACTQTPTFPSVSIACRSNASSVTSVVSWSSHVDPDERAGSVGTRRRGGVGRVNDAREVLLKHIVADVETDLARLHGDAGVDPRSAIDSTRSTYASASASAAGAVPRSARRGGSECRPRPGR